jgi:hypothetical protein
VRQEKTHGKDLVYRAFYFGARQIFFSHLPLPDVSGKMEAKCLRRA